MIKRLIQLVLDVASARKLEREVGRSMKRVAKDSESTFGKAFKKIGAAFVGVFAVRKLVNFTREMFRLGSSAAETASKFETVFGEQRAAELDGFLDRFTRLAGLTRTMGREMLANFGAVFQGAGIAADASAELSQRMVQLAGDLTSFHDVPIEETFAAIRSGATGEAEPLKRFGIVLRAAEVDARALAETGKKTSKELTEQERVVARLELIYEKAGKAVGDLVRTQDSEANRARQINGRYQRIRETIAIGLLPALSQLLPVFEQLAAKAETFALKVSGAVQALLEMAGLVNQTVAIEIAGITRALEGMGRAQREAFLLSRLRGAAAEYEEIRRKIAAIEEESRGLQPSLVKADGARANRNAAVLAELRRELETAGEVMNAISRMLATPPAAPPAPPAPTSARTPPADDERLKREADLRRLAADAAQRHRDKVLGLQASLQQERIAMLQGEEAALRFQLALQGITGAEADLIVAQTEVNAALQRTQAAATAVAGGMTSAFEQFFQSAATGFDDFGHLAEAVGAAARGIAAAVITGLAHGMAEYHTAKGVGKLAEGTWPPNPAAILSATKHFAAAGLFEALPSVIGAIGAGAAGGAAGAGASVPLGAIATSSPGIENVPPPEIHIYLDPLAPGDPRFQRVVEGASQASARRFGSNVQVHVHPRSDGRA